MSGVATLLFATRLIAQQPQPFTLQQVFSAPYATELTAAPTGNLFAWVEDSEGRHNLWIGGPGTPARQLTHNTLDDGLDLTGLTWSPDATAIATTYGTETGADGKPSNPAHLQRSVEAQVIVQPVAPDAQPRRIGAGHAPLFSPDGRTLYFIRAGQVWISPTDQATAPSQLILDRGNASSLTLSPDGNTLAFISTRRETNQPSHRFLALFDLTTHTLTFPAPSTGNDSAPAWSPDGQHLAWLRSPFTRAPEFALNRTSPNPWSIQLLDLATHTTHTVFAPTPNQPGSVLPHMATGEPRLFWTADNRLIFPSEADGYVHLYALNPATQTPPTLLTPGPYEIEDPALSPDRKTLAYASNDAVADPLDTDRRHLWSLDLTQPKPSPIAVTHGTGIETRPAFTAAGTLVALVATTQSPMAPALISATGAITPLHPAAAPPGYPAAALITPQQILFTAADGLPLHAQLFLPPHLDPSHKHPAILFFHGGPRRQMLLGYPAMGYYANAYAMNQYLASQGFIVLSTNYRCGIGYGLDFRQCAHAGADGAAEYADLLAAHKYLAGRPDVDPHRIGVWGGSYGGYLTALALARNSGLFAAGVDFHGVHDWNLEDNAADWLAGSYAERDTIAALALASSPLGSLAHWRSPILLIHGDDDNNVAYAQTPVLADRLRAQGVDVQELIFPDEIHEFELHADWLKAYAAEAAFFTRILKPQKPAP